MKKLYCPVFWFTWRSLNAKQNGEPIGMTIVNSKAAGYIPVFTSMEDFAEDFPKTDCFELTVPIGDEYKKAGSN